MILINDVYLHVNDFANKHQTGATISPEEFNRIVKNIVYAFVRKCYGLEDQYQPGMPLPKIAYEITQLVSDYLEEIKMSDVNLIVDADGKGIKPADYLHHSALAYEYFERGDPAEPDEAECCDENDPTQQTTKAKLNMPVISSKRRDIQVFKESEWNFQLQSAISPPTKEYPAAVYRKGHIQFAPKDLKKVLYSYLRYPKIPLFTYDIDVDGNVVFQLLGGAFPIGNAGAQNIELPAICEEQITNWVAQRMGIFSRDAALVSVTENIKNTGQ